MIVSVKFWIPNLSVYRTVLDAKKLLVVGGLSTRIILNYIVVHVCVEDKGAINRTRVRDSWHVVITDIIKKRRYSIPKTYLY